MIGFREITHCAATFIFKLFEPPRPEGPRNTRFLCIQIVFLSAIISTFIYTFRINVVLEKDYHLNRLEPLYNVGDILNLPRLHESATGGYAKVPHYDIAQYERACTTFVPSIVSIYCGLRQDNNEIIPNSTKVREAVDTYLHQKGSNIPYIETVTQNGSLCVHLRSGDKGVIESVYLRAIRSLSFNYSNIFILNGLHNRPKGIHVDDKSKLTVSLQKVKSAIISSNAKVVFTSNNPDNDLAIMRKCQNILLHKGGFSELGSFLFQGDHMYLVRPLFPSDYRQNEHRNNMAVEPIWIE
jgi:hypothetical protein